MKWINVLLISILIAGCEKPEARSCFKKSGEYSEKKVTFGSFNQLFLKEHIEYKLIQDSLNFVIIKGGKNLLDFIDVTSEQGLLSIKNRNRCNFLRHYEVPVVEIHYTKLINILFEGTERLYNEDTLITDYLTLTLRDGAGRMDLNVKALDINAINTHGWGGLTLRGQTGTLHANLMGDGVFDFKDLNVQTEAKLITSSSVDQYIAVNAIPFSVELNGVGNVLYYGMPTVLNKSIYGKGKLIHVQ